MMNALLYSLFMFLLVTNTPAQAWFLPEEFKVDLESLPQGRSNITEQEFKVLLSEIGEIYTPIVSSHGGRLAMQGQWKNETPNARAAQMFGTWRVEVTGGLARRPELTPDGLALIVCHELGHHLGGFPFAPSTPIPIPVPGVETWAATEGQSDYYATQICARNIWGHQHTENLKYRDIATDEHKSYCDSIWQHMEDRDLCYRNVVATESVILTMATLMKKEVMPRFDTPDPSQVDKTNTKHPDAQCRMDTSLQGALCLTGYPNSLIPGKKVPGGTESIDAEKEALENSCSHIHGHTVGVRPGCWFKSRL